MGEGCSGSCGGGIREFGSLGGGFCPGDPIPESGAGAEGSPDVGVGVGTGVEKRLFVLLVSAAPVLATEPVTGPIGATGPGGLGLEYGESLGLGSRDIRDTIATIIRTALGLLGIVAVVIIIMGGFTWMTAGGNDEKVEEAKKRLIQGVIGLAIVLASYALASYVISQLIGATA